MAPSVRNPLLVIGWKSISAQSRIATKSFLQCFAVLKVNSSREQFFPEVHYNNENILQRSAKSHQRSWTTFSQTRAMFNLNWPQKRVVSLLTYQQPARSCSTFHLQWQFYSRIVEKLFFAKIARLCANCNSAFCKIQNEVSVSNRSRFFKDTIYF